MLTRRTRIGQFTLRRPAVKRPLFPRQHAGIHDGWPTKADEAEEAARELQRQAVDLRDGARLTKPLEALRNQQGLASAHLRDAIYDTQAIAEPFLAVKEKYDLNRLNDLKISVVEKEDLTTNINTFGRVIQSHIKDLGSCNKDLEYHKTQYKDSEKYVKELEEAAEKCENIARNHWRKAPERQKRTRQIPEGRSPYQYQHSGRNHRVSNAESRRNVDFLAVRRFRDRRVSHAILHAGSDTPGEVG